MRKHSKRFTEQQNLINKELQYQYLDGLELLKKISNVKYIETVEAHINLNVDPKYNDQQLRATLTLPKGTGKSVTIGVVTNEENIESALSAGAAVAGSDSFIEEIAKEKINFDVLIATPDQMPKLARLGKILGPKGLMPSPKSGTVSKDITATISEFKKGKLEYRVDKTGIVHIPFGKLNFNVEDLGKNLLAVYESILKNKPIGVKGKYFKNFYICSTMSPSILIDINSLK